MRYRENSSRGDKVVPKFIGTHKVTSQKDEESY